jgi:hypothetical protein
MQTNSKYISLHTVYFLVSAVSGWKNDEKFWHTGKYLFCGRSSLFLNSAFRKPLVLTFLFGHDDDDNETTPRISKKSLFLQISVFPTHTTRQDAHVTSP